MSTATLDLTPCKGRQDRWHYIPDLGRSDYGDPAETLLRVNAETVLAELQALGVEAFTEPIRTWLCPAVALVVDAYHPATLPYLRDLADRLDVYGVLDEEALARAEWEDGYCQSCGSLGLPERWGLDDVCESCGYCPSI
jgi:hypothetical protein